MAQFASPLTAAEWLALYTLHLGQLVQAGAMTAARRDELVSTALLPVDPTRLKPGAATPAVKPTAKA